MKNCIPTRNLYCGLAWLFVALAAVSVFTSLLPTTLFLLLAAWLFVRGSERLRRWLLANPVVGPALETYQEFGVVSPSAKRGALLALWIGMAVGATIFASGGMLAFYAFGGLGVTLTTLIGRLPTDREFDARQYGFASAGTELTFQK